MSSEGVKRYGVSGPDWEVNEEADGEFALWTDYAALEAECERLRQTLDASKRVTIAVIHERDALSAELAALKAASGEEVEVVGYRSGTSGMIYETAYGLQQPQDLMTVAQHQRITAALRGEVEQFKQANRELSESNVKRRDELRKLRAELDALRKQEPVKLSADVQEYLQEGINSATQCEDEDMDYDFANELGKLLGTLYAAPPAAAMDGGMVEGLIAAQKVADRIAGNDKDFDDWTRKGAGIVSAELRAILAAHRQASQQEGEKT